MLSGYKSHIYYTQTKSRNASSMPTIGNPELTYETKNTNRNE
jgi:hypothetical protein